MGDDERWPVVRDVYVGRRRQYINPVVRVVVVDVLIVVAVPDVGGKRMGRCILLLLILQLTLLQDSRL